MSFQITNYSNKKAANAGLKAGKTIHLIITPLSRQQELANREAEEKGYEPPFILQEPKPNGIYDIISFKNKQVPAWTATVVLDHNCNVVNIS